MERMPIPRSEEKHTPASATLRILPEEEHEAVLAQLAAAAARTRLYGGTAMKSTQTTPSITHKVVIGAITDEWIHASTIAEGLGVPSMRIQSSLRKLMRDGKIVSRPLSDGMAYRLRGASDRAAKPKKRRKVMPLSRGRRSTQSLGEHLSVTGTAETLTVVIHDHAETLSVDDARNLVATLEEAMAAQELTDAS